MTKYSPKIGDIVTTPGSDARWMVLSPAGIKRRDLLCDCPSASRSYTSPSHSHNCEAMQHFNRPSTYWLQNAETGALYRPNGKDEAVHKSALTLVMAHKMSSKRELAQAELF